MAEASNAFGPVSHEKVSILTEDDIVIVRQRVRALAQEKHFDSFAVAALTTAASELARNIWMHAGSGTVSIDVLNDGQREGLRLVFQDKGPGIPDIEQALSEGFSTSKTLGLGLPGTKRLVDEFDISSTVSQGTTITVVKWNAVY